MGLGDQWPAMHCYSEVIAMWLPGGQIEMRSVEQDRSDEGSRSYVFDEAETYESFWNETLHAYLQNSAHQVPTNSKL